MYCCRFLWLVQFQFSLRYSLTFTSLRDDNVVHRNNYSFFSVLSKFKFTIIFVCFIALKYRDGKYILNGHRRLSSVGKYEAAGTTFTYNNRASKHCPGECLLADGPTNKDLEIIVMCDFYICPL